MIFICDCPYFLPTNMCAEWYDSEMFGENMGQHISTLLMINNIHIYLLNHGILYWFLASFLSIKNLPWYPYRLLWSLTTSESLIFSLHMIHCLFPFKYLPLAKQSRQIVWWPQGLATTISFSLQSKHFTSLIHFC